MDRVPAERDNAPQHVPSSAGPALSPHPGAGVSNRAVAGALESAQRGQGEPLPADLAAGLSAALGADLSPVRVHRSEASAGAASALGAKAFTVNSDIHFGAGQYEPDTAAGRQVVAHEAAHTVQQGGVGRADPAALAVSSPSDRAEVEAGAFARLGPTAAPVRSRTNAPVVHRDPLTSPDDVSHQPQHENTQVAVWDSTIASEVSTTTMVGGLFNMALGITGLPGREMGHYSTEEAAVAAIRSFGGVGAVFLENGRYVAYNAEDNSWVYSFTYDNVRWVAGKPWTAVRFTSDARVVVTQDGVALRREMYTTEDEAENRLADQALMPGGANPFQGYLDVHGDFNALGEQRFLTAFAAAMRDNGLSVLARSRVLVEQEIERRAPGAAGISADEIALMRHTVEYLAGIDEEMDAIPKSLPWPDEMDEFLANKERFDALADRRRVVLARYPMLARVDAREFARLSPEEQNRELHADAIEVLADVDETRDNVIDGDLDLWTLRPVVESTLAGLGITDPDRRGWAMAKHEAEVAEDRNISIAMTVFSIGFGLAAAVVGGPAGVALAAGALGIGAADAMMATEKYFVESAAGNTALDPSQSIVPPDLAGHWGWLVVAWLGVVADAADVLRAVRAVKASGAVGDGISALSRGDRALATRLRVAAGDIADDEIISEATRAAVGRQVGADIEIDPALGTEIQVHYTPGPRGEIVFGGIRCGATANVLEILAHAEVVRLLRRYEGLTGQVRRLWDAMLSLGGPNPARPFPPGSMAFESWLEMQKLPEILEIRRAALGQAIGRDGEELLRRDVEFLEAEYRRHAEVVDQMIIERGANFVARAEERTAEAVAAGMPALDGHPLIADASKYYYRSNPGGSPPYVLCRISTESTPARTLVPDGGGWRIAEGALSRGEQATAMVAGWPAHAQTAFDAVKAAHAGQRVVPLQGLATVGKTIGDLPPPGLFDRLRVILVEAYTRAGDPDALGKATEAARAVVEHKIVVVRGTDQLRAFNYRLNFTGSADEIASTDLHHIIPLQLGGDHRRLVAVQRDLHDRLHDLIDELQLGDGTLAPNSIRSSGDLIFAEGAAVLRADGSVQLARLNPDGTYTLVP
ncbi:eCIS core domain-containing protein [Virgisporangium aurantiacum]|uniref:eCIS core domain-containing protein n=1 Tax=Virgisporangium aurantiacum TaxID=175570 RepID=A0A8J4E4N0_9ACTN|nr:DUF4157 domain-containing protein [Virgisporangium aurantiacum]GIJ61269.1 hypothetical protein Vau01_087850 [Virgisporangium aurantiacum]